jgi:hypothetical protein
VQELGEKVDIQIKKGEITEIRALQLQENSDRILMLLFNQWIRDNDDARLFLKDHDGFNFMLKRLF